jgi:hypothetical protein
MERPVAVGERRSWPAALAAGLLVVASALPIAWVEARPRDDREVAVIFAPWVGSEGAFTRATKAGGLVVREGALANILVVHSDGRGLIDRLYAMGAWAVIDPVAFGGCFVKSPGQDKAR